MGGRSKASAIERSSGVIRDLGRVGGSRAGRHAGRWTGRLVACVWLSIATPSAAVQPTPDPTSYAECLRIYSHRADAATMCRAMFPLSRTTPIVRATPTVGAVSPTPAPATPPYATPPSTSTAMPSATATPPATSTPPSRTPPREPVDITPGVTKLLEAWANRPRTPKPPPGPPADPLAVIPEIQAACARYAGNVERWRRCTTDAWNAAGLRGQPPVVLQVPPAAPPVYEPPPPLRPEPPVQGRPPPQPPVHEPPPVVQPEPPVADVTSPPTTKPAPPPAVAAPPPQPALPVQPTSSSIPLWAWLAVVLAVLVAAAGGFGLAKVLGKAKPRPSRLPEAETATCAPTEVVLVADPGVVVLTPDGPPRAGMAVSMRFALDSDRDHVRLDYPSLETAP